MKSFRKNLFFASAISLALVVEPLSVSAGYNPDNILADCPVSPGISAVVNVTQPILEYNPLNVGYEQYAGYCFNKYFSGPTRLTYTVTLCDQGWNPIPGVTIGRHTFGVDDEWVYLLSSSSLAGVPLSVNDIGLYYLNVEATDGVTNASQQFKINVYQFDNGQQIDYTAYWVSISAVVVAAIPYIYKIYDNWGTIWGKVKEFENQNRKLAGALLGAAAGLVGGWIGEWVHIKTSDTPEDAFQQALWLVPVVGAGGVVLGTVVAALVAKIWRNTYTPLPQ